MKRNSVYFTIAVILIVSAMVLAYIYPFAKSEPVSGGNATATASSTQTFNVDRSNKKITVSSAEELRKISLLGGTNSELALEKNHGLGIAKEFSIFAEGDVTFTGADTEGKVAAGGGVYGQAVKKVNGEDVPYQYQIGLKNTDKYSADIVVGNGPVEGIALDYGYTDDGLTQTEDNKIVAYSPKATNMNLESYTEDEKKHFVEAELIDFKSEFDRLRAYSQELANKENSTEKLEGKYSIVGNKASYINKIIEEHEGLDTYAGSDMVTVTYDNVIVFKGTNEDVNYFNVSLNDYSAKESGIVFDIPYNSKAVLNIMDDNFEIDYGGCFNIFYPLSEEKIAEINVNDNKIGYVIDYTQRATADKPGNYIRDENDSVKPFIRIAGGYANEGNVKDLSENILINVPNAQNFKLYDCGVSVLAPNADVTSTIGNGKSSVFYNDRGGYFLGTLICKSYNGHLQFGSIPKNITRKYIIDVNKIDDKTQEEVVGAEFELTNSNGDVINSWTSSTENKKMELDIGTYKLKETKMPDNYDGGTPIDMEFSVNPDGTIINVNGEKIGSAEIQFDEEYVNKTYFDRSADWNIGNGFAYSVTQNNIYEARRAGVDFDNIVPNVEDNIYTTEDGGRIVISSSSDNLVIPAEQTKNNKEISYNIVDKKVVTSVSSWDVAKRNSIIKYDSENKVEWVANLQSESEVFNAGNVIETDDRYIIVGGMSSFVVYVDGSQTQGGEEITDNGYPNPGPPTLSFALFINKNGKIETIEEFDYSIINGKIEKSGVGDLSSIDPYSNWNVLFNNVFVKSGDKIILMTYVIDDFPVSWDKLYKRLDEKVGNITKVSFEIDTSEATEYQDENLFMIVAENNAMVQKNIGNGIIANNWVEFIKYREVKNGDSITTDVPLVKDFYPYVTGGVPNDSVLVKFKPHFYRQTDSDTEAKEVFDVKVKNIKAYWKDVQYTKGTKSTNISLAVKEPITVLNKHITTTVKVTKIDANSKKKLSGAVFGIFSSDSNELLYTSEKTDKNGEIVSSDLALDKGIYYVKEIEAPEGYELSTESKEFVVDGTNSQEFTFENVVKSKEEEKKEDSKEEEQKQEEPRKESKQEPQQVQTGDTLFIALIVLGLAVIGCGATFVLKEYYK